MKSIQALRERRTVLAKSIEKIMDENEGLKWNKDHQAMYDQAMSEIEAINNEAGRIQATLDALKDDPAALEDELRNRHTKTPGAHKGDPVEAAALRAYLSSGIAGLTDDMRRLLAGRQTPDIRAAYGVREIQAAMSTTTNAEGGFTVAVEYMRELEVAMKIYGGMREVAGRIRTASGATMNFPANDPTAEVGEIVGQNATVARLDTVLSNIALDVYKYSSKDIAIPFELIQDTFIDLESYIRDLLAMRIGRIQNTHFTVGTGTAQPFGVAVGAAAGKTGLTGQTLTVIYDDLVDLEHSVDPSYRRMPGVGYMMHDLSLRVVRKLKDTQGRPIFVPGYETGVPGGAPDTLLGRPIYINQDIAQMAANAKSILFGAFSKYKIRDVMDLTLFRMTDSAFTRNGQVGFLGFMRSGGRLIDVGGAIKSYVNSAT